MFYLFASSVVSSWLAAYHFHLSPPSPSSSCWQIVISSPEFLIVSPPTTTYSSLNPPTQLCPIYQQSHWHSGSLCRKREISTVGVWDLVPVFEGGVWQNRAQCRGQCGADKGQHRRFHISVKSTFCVSRQPLWQLLLARVEFAGGGKQGRVELSLSSHTSHADTRPMDTPCIALYCGGVNTSGDREQYLR